jgi:hypothetical protein
MYRAKRLGAVWMIVIGSTWLIHLLIVQYTHITKPVFIWVLGAVVIGILLRKLPKKRAECDESHHEMMTNHTIAKSLSLATM